MVNNLTGVILTQKGMGFKLKPLSLVPRIHKANTILKIQPSQQLTQ